MSVEPRGSGADQGETDARRALRRGVYLLLAALSLGNAVGRLLAVDSVNRAEAEKRAVSVRLDSLARKLAADGLAPDEVAAELERKRPEVEREERLMRPFLSANDRSRWLAIRALVDHGQFEIDPLLDRRVWNTIDMVQHRSRDGELHLYSSKPPLSYLPTAGVYWLVKHAAGWTLADEPHAVVRLVVAIVNVVPLMLLIGVAAALAERFGATDWGRMFVVAAAALGTMHSAFVVVLNNHLHGALFAAIALYAVVRIVADGDERLRWFALAGAAAALTAAHELPALSLTAVVGVGLLWLNPRATLQGFAPAAVVVAAAFFGTNYAAHASWRPPYAHRSVTDPEDNWYDYSYDLEGRTIDSYWRNPQGIDRGEPSRAAYAFHCLVGHHGVFSLTPVWLLSMFGLALWLRGDDRFGRAAAAAIMLLTLVCLAFYISRPLGDRNYGGMTSGLRWMFWFSPLWLWAMIPAADRLCRSRTAQAFGATLLAISVLSASYPTWNPWVMPWLVEQVR